MARRVSLLLLSLLVFAAAGARVRAAGEGEVRILLRGEEMPLCGAQVELYPAGYPTEQGYCLTEEFGGGVISQLDVFSPELAVWLSQRAEGGQSAVTDTEGCAVFGGLDEGLYLVMQTSSLDGYRPFEPFLITIPWDGYRWQITAQPKTEREITVVPNTADPGTVELGIGGMMISSASLGLVLLHGRKQSS